MPISVLKLFLILNFLIMATTALPPGLQSSKPPSTITTGKESSFSKKLSVLDHSSSPQHDIKSPIKEFTAPGLPKPK
jgi:hypothetical protein